MCCYVCVLTNSWAWNDVVNFLHKPKNPDTLLFPWRNLHEKSRKTLNFSIWFLDNTFRIHMQYNETWEISIPMSENNFIMLYDSTSQYDYELWNMILSNPFDPLLNLADSCQNQNNYNQSNWKFSWDGVGIKGHIESHQVKWMKSYLHRLCNCLLEKSDEFMPGFIGICGDAVPGLSEIHSWVTLVWMSLCEVQILLSQTKIFLVLQYLIYFE